MIITAAGLSRRNPGKLLYKLGKQSVIRQTVSRFTKCSCDIVVVTGHEREKIESQFQQTDSNIIKFTFNPNYRAGLASSLAAGIASVPDLYTYYGFCNGDKPFIKSGTIGKLLDYLEAKQPVVLLPEYRAEPGHPAFFHRSLRTSLLKLSGDSGGRQLIPGYRDETVFLQVDDEGVCLDMDKYFSEKTAQDIRVGNAS